MKVSPPPETGNEEFDSWFRRFWDKFTEEDMSNSATWNPGSIAVGAKASTTVTITGVALGDYAIASFSLDIQELNLGAAVISANTVEVTLSNNTAGAVDLASGTVYARAFRRTA